MKSIVCRESVVTYGAGLIGAGIVFGTDPSEGVAFLIVILLLLIVLPIKLGPPQIGIPWRKGRSGR
ncbi:MAG TPA: hypothetical protein VHI77_03965 [Solirubrobacterales bacterium]|nr:hypothetical protein [Solirubrobacterales bacterium]